MRQTLGVTLLRSMGRCQTVKALPMCLGNLLALNLLYDFAEHRGWCGSEGTNVHVGGGRAVVLELCKSFS